jgi:hypothetical protein
MSYHLDGKTFVLENFSALPPFSSFLPGVSGIQGVPLWAFYVNRGQCVASFGVEDKDHPIMEFSPAVIAYEDTERKGFRTFVRMDGLCYEPFSGMGEGVTRKMIVEANCLTIEESYEQSQLVFTVTYFLLPDEDFGALVRRVTVENRSSKRQTFDVMDGMARIVPYGLSNVDFKDKANLMKSYSDVTTTEEGVSFFATRSSVADSDEVSATKGGFFYCSAHNGTIIPPICDAVLLFGQDTGYGSPAPFYQKGGKELRSMKQYCDNKIPCAFTGLSLILDPGKTTSFHTLIGFGESERQILLHTGQMKTAEWIADKQKRAEQITGELTREIETHTALPAFDAYISQCYLDNLLRGGWPYTISRLQEKRVLHLFSRKHGDLERDYNFFRTEAGYYSQGNGNFRDVCQNRRSEILFHPEIGDFDVRTFVNLLQIDGYNPLELRPSLFCLRKENEKAFEDLCKQAFSGGPAVMTLTKALTAGATPGDICRIIRETSISLSMPLAEFVEGTLILCVQEQQAAFKEGYWSDHFTYVPDLVNSYLQIFPENRNRLLFEELVFRFYDSPALVLPRHQKYGLQNGKVRQYGSCIPDPGKTWNKDETHWLKNEKGEIAFTSLICKLYLLSVIKCATLDPMQMGVEMEAGKPGWNDAFNGLPGLLGSSTSETVDLLSLVKDLQHYLATGPEMLRLPAQIDSLGGVLDRLIASRLSGDITEHTFWDHAAQLRESWRERTHLALSSGTVSVSNRVLAERLLHQQKLLEKGLDRAAKFGPIIPSYFMYHAVEYTKLMDASGQEKRTAYGLPAVRADRFEAEALQVFLETPAKRIKQISPKQATALYQSIRESELYDTKLQMYKTSVPIQDMSFEVGRIRSFTPGWFERESIFLHMQYKYLLALIEAGLYDVFYEEISHLMIPFLDPAIYGRSILENSSFLASGANSDPALQGRGFVSRLSGSTAEAISIWQRMFIGDVLFTFMENALSFTFHPVLPGWFFDEDGVVRFPLFGCTVTYRNPLRKNTYGADAVQIRKIRIDSEVVSENASLTSECAEKLRNGSLSSMEVEFA